MDTAAQLSPPVRVAILDDHPLIREAISVALKAAGMDVVLCEPDPQPFIQGLVDHDPDVAILDLRLDGSGTRLEGLEVLKHVRRYHPRVRTLVLSAVHDSAIVRDCMDAGASGFLQKRTTLGTDLLHAIEAALHGEPVRLPSAPREAVKPAALSALTARELEVLRFISGGYDNLKIAAYLSISERTVKAHVQSLYQKLRQENRSQLTLRARELGVLPPDGA